MFLKKRSKSSNKKKTEKKLPSLDDYVTFIDKKDYSGAIGILTVSNNLQNDETAMQWLAYSYSKLSRYGKSKDIYDDLIKRCRSEEKKQKYELYSLICKYYLNESEMIVDSMNHMEGKNFELAQDRQLYERLKLVNYLDEVKNLSESVEDSLKNIDDNDHLTVLAIASILFRNGKYEEAEKLFQQIFQKQKDWKALTIYIGMCKFMGNHCEDCLDLCEKYREKDESISLYNLKCCSSYKLKKWKEASKYIDKAITLSEQFPQIPNEILIHNEVIINNERNAQNIFYKYQNIINECNYNLVLSYLNNEEKSLEKIDELILDVRKKVKNRIHLQELEAFYKMRILETIAEDQSNDLIEVQENARKIYESLGDEIYKDLVLGVQYQSSASFLNGNYHLAYEQLNKIKEKDLQERNIIPYKLNKCQLLLANNKFDNAKMLLDEMDNFDIIDGRLITMKLYCFIKLHLVNDSWNAYFNQCQTNDTHTIVHQPNLLKIIAYLSFENKLYESAAKAFSILYSMENDMKNFEGLFVSILLELKETGEMKRKPNHSILATLFDVDLTRITNEYHSPAIRLQTFLNNETVGNESMGKSKKKINKRKILPIN
ncbi:hypothetical protein SNEBB_008144 [Seison nebaliae]|nr:hypothetical protein SNEBB_008144 [Seison nebaliae]